MGIADEYGFDVSMVLEPINYGMIFLFTLKIAARLIDHHVCRNEDRDRESNLCGQRPPGIARTHDQN
jgi:hypothetical protein